MKLSGMAKILVLMIAICFATGTSAFALPHVDKVVRGDVNIKTEEAKMTINASSGSIINYSSFDILDNESVFVTLPTVNSKILNRVTGNDPSDLLGNLNCNGLFILVNESGIHVGPDAKINVGSLILSTRDISDSNFINGDYLFKKFSKEELDMLLLNEGHITISDGGFGVLIAGAVENRGIITARVGKIALAGGDAIRLDIAGGGLISVAIEEGTARTILDAQGKPITDQIKNTGTLRADGGMVILKAENITDIFRSVINLEGYVSATRVDDKDGEVRLITEGNVRVDAEVNATRIVIGDEAEAVPENVALEGGRLEAEESVQVLSKGDIKVNNIIRAHEGDIVLFADHDRDGVGEFTQEGGIIEAKGEGDIYIDGSGDMTIGELKTERGAIKIGETLAPQRVIGLPEIVHARGRYLEVTAHEFYINSESRTTHLIKPEGSLLVEEVVHMNGEDLVALGFGGVGEVKYLETNNITLELPRGDINTVSGVIIPGNQVKLSARGIGSYDHPVGINADITYINRIQGDIDVSGMWGLGTTLFIRGPSPAAGSDSWGAVSYNKGSHLVLETDEDINIISNLVAKTIHLRSNREDIYVHANLQAHDNITLEAPYGLIKTRGEMSANMQDGTIIFKGAGLDLGGDYKASFIDFDPANIWINNPITTSGNVSFTATNDIYVNADVSTDSGTLTFTADSDNNEEGAFIQASDTEIRTTTSGNVYIYGAEASVDKVTSAGALYVARSSGSAMPGDITINDALTAAGIVKVYSKNDVSVRGDIQAGSYLDLSADYDEDGVGDLTFLGNPTLTAKTTSYHRIRSANDITIGGTGLTAGGTPATFSGGRSLYVYATGNSASTELTVNSNLSKTGDVSLYSWDDLSVEANITAGGHIYLVADNDQDGTGNLTFSGNPTLTVGGVYSHFFRSANDLTIGGSTLTAGGTSATLSGGKNLLIYATGQSAGTELTVNSSLNRGSGGIYLSSSDDLSVEADVTGGVLNLLADYDENGTGNLTFSGNPTLTAGGSADHYIKSANDLTIGGSSLTAGGTSATLAGGYHLYVYATGSGAGTELTANSSLNKPGNIYLYSWDDLVIEADVTAGAYLNIHADNDENGIGNLTFSGNPTLTAGAPSSHRIKSANDITIGGTGLTAGGTSATLSSGRAIYVYATGSGAGTELTVNSSLSRFGDIELYSWDDLSVEADITTGNNLYLYADNDENGTGNLTFSGNPTLAAGGFYSHRIKSANDLIIGGTNLSAGGTSATLSGGGKHLYVYATGSGAGTELTVNSSLSRFGDIELYSWDDLSVEADITAGWEQYLYADNDENGMGNLTFSGNPTLTAGEFYSQCIKAANDLEISGATFTAGGTSATLSGSNYLYVYATGNNPGAELTVSGALSKSGFIYLYSWDDLVINADVTTADFLQTYSDYDEDGTGNFIHTNGTISTTGGDDVNIKGNNVSLGTISANSGSNDIVVTATGNIISNSAIFTASSVALTTTGGDVGTSTTPIPILSGTCIDATALNGSVYISRNSDNFNVRSTSESASTQELGLVITTADYGGVAQDIGDNVIYNVFNNLGLATPGNFAISPGVIFNAYNTDITLGGNWTNKGTFIPQNSVVTFDGVDADNTINSGGSAFYDLVFNSSDGNGAWRLANYVVINNELLMTAGTLQGNYSTTVLGGDVTGDGLIDLSGGTFTLEGSGNFGGNTDWTFYNLTFGNGTDSETTIKTGNNMITSLNHLTIELNHRLEAGSGVWNLCWANNNLTDISQIAGGWFHTLALKSDGSRVYAWGFGGQGQIGINTLDDIFAPVEVLGVGGTGYLSDISQIAAGAGHSLALKSDGSRVYAWGWNENGQVGNNSTINSLIPVEVVGVGGTGYLTDISQIAAGDWHSIALKSDGSRVYTWGSNWYGELGNNTFTDSLVPVEVLKGEQVGPDPTYLSDISQIAAGTNHTIALKSDGSRVYAWGSGWVGQLGNGSTALSPIPVQVLGGEQGGTYLTDISQISSGYHHVIALKSDGSRIYTWGANWNGELGNGIWGYGTHSTTPVEVVGVGGTGYLSDISQIAGGGYHAYALKSDGSRMYAWGLNWYGMLGINSLVGFSAVPVEVLNTAGTAPLTDISHIAGGGYNGYAFKKNDSRPYVWGYNLYGQGAALWNEGIATPVIMVEATATYPLTDISQVAGGYWHSVALNSDGSRVYSWGNNMYDYVGFTGQLGNNSTFGSPTPVQVVGGEQGGTYLTDILQVVAGDYHSVALASNGEVYAWGYNEYGQLGNNTTSDSLIPVKVLGVGGTGYLSDISQIAAGAYHTVALTNGSQVYAWGYNGEGELGNNSTTDSLVPVQVWGGEQGGTYLGDISQIAAGGYHTLALTNGSGIYAWGYNEYGQLGNNLTTNSLVPVQVWGGEQGTTYLTDISQIAAGDTHSVALKSDGSRVYTWGQNKYCQLGNNSIIDSSTPVEVLNASGTAPLTDISQIAAGFEYTIALKSDGSRVYGWGHNDWGQLGNNTTYSYEPGWWGYTEEPGVLLPVETQILVHDPFIVKGGFIYQTSLVQYTGDYEPYDYHQIAYTLVGTTYYDLLINNAAETFLLQEEIVAIRDFELAAGILDVTPDNHPMTVGRNWTNSDTFVPREGTVTFDSLQDSLISGNTLFYNFTCETPAKNLIFEAGSTQTIGGTLTLEGTLDSEVILDTVGGDPNRFTFDVTAGDQFTHFVNVSNSQASSFDIYAIDSVDGPNTDEAEPSPHWIFSGFVQYLGVSGDATMTAGDTNELTITAYDSKGRVSFGYEGSKTLTFSGLGSIEGNYPEVEGYVFGDSGPFDFTWGQTSVDAATLTAYKAETSTVDVTDGVRDSYTLGHYGLDLTVYPAAANQLLWVEPPYSPVNSGEIWAACTIEIIDMYGNRRTSDTNPITVEPANMGGTLTRNAMSGVSTFNDLKYTTPRTVTIQVKGTSPGLADTQPVNVLVNREEPRPPEPPVPPEPPKPPEPPEPTEPTGFDDMMEIVNILKYKKWYEPGKYRTSVIVYEGRVVAAPYTEDGPEFEKGVSLLPGEETKIEGTVPEGKAGTKPRKLTVRKTAEGEIEFTPYGDEELKKREETKKKWEEEGLRRELF